MILTKNNSFFTKELAQIMPVFAFENDKVVFRDGRIAVGFRVHNAAMESWSANQYQSFLSALGQQMAILPLDAVVQKTDIYYDREYDVKQLAAKEYFELKTRRHFLYRLVLQQESYLFISFPAKKKRPKVNPLNTLLIASKAILQNVFADIEDSLELAESKAREFVAGLHGMQGVSFSRLRESELRQLYQRYFNLQFALDPSGIKSEIAADAEGITVGNQRLNMVSLKGQGNFLSSSVKNHYGVEAPFSFPLTHYLQIPHITTTSLKLENTEAILKKLDFKKKLNRSMDWMSTQDNEVQAEEIDQFTHMIRSQGQRIVSLNLNLMVYADAPGIRKNYLEKAVSAMRSMAGAESMVESVDTLALFMANLPGNAFNNYRWLVMSEPMATCYLSFMGQYPEQMSGDVLCDRFLNPVRLNCFNTALANQNAIVIGPSGSGKSFTNGYFLIQRKERGCKQIIIDVGGTYKNMLLTLNGKDFEQTYIEYDPKLMQFAPFLVEKDGEGNYQYHVERGNFLMSLLFTLAKGKDSKNIRQVEKSVLKNLITRYYQHLNQHRLPARFNTFYEYVTELSSLRTDDEQLAKDFKYFDVDEFLTVCRPFYDGDYAQLLNGEAEKDLSEYDLICFDLARIKADTMLYPIISQLITQAALDQIAKFPDQEKYIYMDEAWTMLSDSMSEFIEYMYRTIRKHKGSIWIITQTIHEIIKSPVGQAILGNADTKVLLKHADQQLIEKTASVLGLTTHQQDLLCSLRKEKHFREILVVMADVARVFAIEASAHHATILSSTPDERNEFVRLINHYGNLGQALNEFVERKQKQDATF